MKFRLKCALGLMAALLVVSSVPARTVVKGTIYDATTTEPIPFASIQALTFGRSTVANDQGQYRLVLEPSDSCLIKYTHVTHFSDTVTLALSDSVIVHDVWLQPTLIELRGVRVSAEALDPGEEIIAEAIKRKEEILNRLRNCQFDAYTKLVVRDKKKPDSANIFLITESQVTSFWERPDKYKEVITARRQSRNLSADQNLVSVGEILNFNRDRIELGEELVVSPTARDAREHYRYYLLDTIEIDGARIFVLEVEPRSTLVPLFVGQLQIVDSTFDVVGVDFGLNEGFRTNMLSNLRYVQHFAEFDDKYWMPVEIRLTGEAKFSIPLPGIPRELTFAHVASLYHYQLQEGIPKGTFSDIVQEVAMNADRIDTAQWAAGQTIPLTEQEQRGYARIDSLERAPKPIGKTLLRLFVGLPLLATTQENFFHFNRAEGAYVGAAAPLFRVTSRLGITLNGGYAIDAEKWQYETGLSYLFWRQRSGSLQLSFRDKVANRPTMSFPNNPRMTLPALIEGADPYDYFSEHGFLATASARVLPHTRLALSYRNLRQNSLGKNSDFSFFGPDTLRANTPIADGHLRAATLELRYDSRPIYRLKGRDITGPAATFTQLSFGVEHSSPDLLASDFEFTRYSARLFRRQRLFGLGHLSVQLIGGLSDRSLPPQRYFTMAFDPLQLHEDLGVQTLDTSNFTGDRALSVIVRHEFGNRLFRGSGIPGLKKLPFDFSIHGGTFWTEFHEPLMGSSGEGRRQARTAYSEIGFGLGNLTPFLAPLNGAVYLTWQLSAYETDRFAISWDLGF